MFSSRLIWSRYLAGFDVDIWDVMGFLRTGYSCLGPVYVGKSWETFSERYACVPGQGWNLYELQPESPALLLDLVLGVVLPHLLRLLALPARLP